MAGALGVLRRLRRAALVAVAALLLLLSLPGFLDYLRDPDPGFLAKNLRIVSIQPGSAADEAGLRPGDRVVAIDGQSLRFQSELRGALHALRFEPDYSLTFDRDGGRRLARLRKAVPPADRVRARLVNLLVGLIFLTVGTVVLLRRDDAVGLLFALNSLLFACILMERPVVLHPVLRFAGDVLSDLVQVLIPATLLHFFLLFPAPGPRGVRWRLTGWLYLPRAETT